MATLNKVMLIGRLTDNPEEPRTLPNSGSRVIKFRFAVGRSKKNENGQWENDPNPLYIDCEAFSRPDTRRDLVNLIQQYAKKGDSLYLEGRLQLDQWEDKNGGGKRSKHKLVIDSLEFIGNTRGDGEGGGGGGSSFNRGGDRPVGAGRTQGRTPTQTPPADDHPGEYNNGSDSGGGDIPF